ncbi:MAG: sugar ABC transporter permease [Clostridia bacterium]|nr:sugar ABC transporter permease [Clostridia bacterium]
MKKLSYERKKAYYGYLFISVWAIGFIFFFLSPFITSVRYSLAEVTIQQGYVGLNSCGFNNYINLFIKNPEFMPAFTDTVTSVAVKSPLIIIFSLFVAVVLNQSFKGRTFFRAVFFLPVIIAGGIAIEIINGNYYLGLITTGGRSDSLFESQSIAQMLANSGVPQTAVDYIIKTVNEIFGLLWNSGIQILIFIAGLQSIPTTLYEVANVEGSNGWTTFWKVTVPMLAPMLIVNVFYTVVDNMISFSNEMFKLIDGYLNNLKFDEAAAMAIINFVIVFVMVILIYVIGNKSVYYAVD